jgi:hypothetical protein
VKKLSENNSFHLLCFPLEITGKIKTLSGMNTFHLIWLNCNLKHTFKDVTVTKRDRDRIQFPHVSYVRGLKDLEEIGLITVSRKVGRCCRISVNTDLIDQKAKNFIKGVK